MLANVTLTECFAVLLVVRCDGQTFYGRISRILIALTVHYQIEGVLDAYNRYLSDKPLAGVVCLTGIVTPNFVVILFALQVMNYDVQSTLLGIENHCEAKLIAASKSR